MICTSLERFWPGSVSTSATTGFTELLTVTNTSATTGFTELLTVTNINSLVVTSSSGNNVCAVKRAKKLLFYN